MTHPALEARARGALKPLPDDGDFTVPLTIPAELLSEIYKAACLARTTPTALILDVLRDAFPPGVPR